MVKKQAQNELFTEEICGRCTPTNCVFIYRPHGTNKHPVSGRLLAVGLSLFKGHVTVAAYHVNLPRRSNEGSAMRADVLDAAILAGAAPTFDGRGRFVALVIVRLGFDLEHRFAAGGYILHSKLLGQP